ncbi:hypothetical protein VNO77_04200 [Canavalia gladiata]|uniref:Uncharacterized protein n=1 Tax=Canavalia gladiata TaxID=3824 RepID=A0AAN9MW37_CANGL
MSFLLFESWTHESVTIRPLDLGVPVQLQGLPIRINVILNKVSCRRSFFSTFPLNLAGICVFSEEHEGVSKTSRRLPSGKITSSFLLF